MSLRDKLFRSDRNADATKNSSVDIRITPVWINVAKTSPNRFETMNRNVFSRLFCLVLILVALALATSIAMLIWYILTCSSEPCPTTISSTSSSPFTTITTTSSSSLTSSTTTSAGTKRNYGETCEQIEDCHTEFGLLCQYGWEQNRKCLCEGSHYWSTQQNQCRK